MPILTLKTIIIKVRSNGKVILVLLIHQFKEGDHEIGNKRAILYKPKIPKMDLKVQYM